MLCVCGAFESSNGSQPSCPGWGAGVPKQGSQGLSKMWKHGPVSSGQDCHSGPLNVPEPPALESSLKQAARKAARPTAWPKQERAADYSRAYIAMARLAHGEVCWGSMSDAGANVLMLENWICNIDNLHIKLSS